RVHRLGNRHRALAPRVAASVTAAGFATVAAGGDERGERAERQPHGAVRTDDIVVAWPAGNARLNGCALKSTPLSKPASTSKMMKVPLLSTPAGTVKLGV